MNFLLLRIIISFIIAKYIILLIIYFHPINRFIILSLISSKFCLNTCFINLLSYLIIKNEIIEIDRKIINDMNTFISGVFFLEIKEEFNRLKIRKS